MPIPTLADFRANLATLYAAVVELTGGDHLAVVAINTVGLGAPSLHIQPAAFERCRAMLTNIDGRPGPSGVTWHVHAYFGTVSVVAIYDARPEWARSPASVDPDPALLAELEASVAPTDMATLGVSR